MWKRLVADDVKLEFHPGPHPPASQTKHVHVTAFVLTAFYPPGILAGSCWHSLVSLGSHQPVRQTGGGEPFGACLAALTSVLTSYALEHVPARHTS